MVTTKSLLGASVLAACTAIAACSDRDTKVINPAPPPVSTAPASPADAPGSLSTTSSVTGPSASADLEQLKQQLAAVSAKVSELEQKYNIAVAPGASSGTSSSSAAGGGSATGTTSGSGSSTLSGGSSAPAGSMAGGTSSTTSTAGGAVGSDETTRLKQELDTLHQRLREVEQRQQAIGAAASSTR